MEQNNSSLKDELLFYCRMKTNTNVILKFAGLTNKIEDIIRVHTCCWAVSSCNKTKRTFFQVSVNFYVLKLSEDF